MPKATKSKQSLFGEIGENYAVKLLKKKGYKIIDKNFRTKFGEIDIVAIDTSLRGTQAFGSEDLDDELGLIAEARRGKLGSGQSNDALVFVEVKTRRSKKYGKPEEAVTPEKLKKIIKTGQIYVKLNPDLPKKLRVDVVAIEVWGEKVISAKIIKVF